MNSQLSLLPENANLSLKQKDIFLKIERFEISALERTEKSLFFNFEHYDLAIHLVDESKTW